MTHIENKNQNKISQARSTLTTNNHVNSEIKVFNRKLKKTRLVTIFE